MEFIKAHFWEAIGILLAYLSLVVPIIQYIGLKKLEERDKRFIAFHELIRKFVEPEGEIIIRLDRQIAIAFELRNYSEYYEVIERILSDLKIYWKDQDPRLLKEMSLTLEYISFRKRFVLVRWWYLFVQTSRENEPKLS